MQLEQQINDAIFERFTILQKKGRLAHAYLFVGPSNIGKGETALAIAKSVNCEAVEGEEFCDTCPSCVKINSGNHPDIFVIDNGYGESIKIEQIRELLSRTKLRAFMAQKKVYILKNIENLTLEGANAFLKTLEEPAADSLLLLTTSVLEKNLDTIKSRCHMIHFPSMPQDELTGKLRKECGADEADSRFLAYFAQGCLGAAKELERDGFTERKNVLINKFILSRPEEALIKKTLGDKEVTKELLDILLSWIRDTSLVKAGVEDARLIHSDRVNDLRKFQKSYTFEELSSINESIVKMCQLLADNLNIKIPLMIIGEQLWGR